MSSETITGLGTFIAISLVLYPLIQIIKYIVRYFTEINAINNITISIQNNNTRSLILEPFIKQDNYIKKRMVVPLSTSVDLNDTSTKLHLIITTRSSRKNTKILKRDLDILLSKIENSEKSNIKRHSTDINKLSSNTEIVYDLIGKDGDVISSDNKSLVMESNND